MAHYIGFVHKKIAFEACNFLPNQLLPEQKNATQAGLFTFFPSFEILGNFVNEYSKNVCF